MIGIENGFVRQGIGLSNEEVIEILKEERYLHLDSKTRRAFGRAITAMTILKAEPCEDAIDRWALRAQFNHLDEVYEEMSEEEKHEAYIYGQIIRAIDDALPVVPKQKTGKWVSDLQSYGYGKDDYHCSICGRGIHLCRPQEQLTDYPYCHCGAKMERNGEK